jgi:hypothetical protein
MANQLIHFGKLSLLYEDGFVRYIRAGEIEILRKIYFALRDSNWTTADIVRSDERISVTTNGFDISYVATNVVDGKEVFKWFVKISGNESGKIDFSVDGEALAGYNRNRAGICVLHPIRETKNVVATVTRPDGSTYEEEFPSAIKPDQPFLDIQKMSWELNGLSRAQLEFEGDIFEMEDQRNWSDTSFKTYSTPLSVPYPVMLKPGDRVNQRVTLKIIDLAGLPVHDLEEEIEVVLHNEVSHLFPKVGTDFSGESASAKDVDLLKTLDFEHLRIDLVLSSSSWKEKLKSGLDTANKIETNVFIHLTIDKVEEWDEFASHEIQHVSKLAISPLDRKANVDLLLEYILPKARKLFPKTSIGAGFRSYFTELNRNRFNYNSLDFVIYPVTPQAHAGDSLTIVENLQAQEEGVKSAKLLAPGKKIHVGLVTIKQRFNPDAKAGTPVKANAGFDERQQTSLIAGWMLGSIKYLSEGGADSITLFESNGLAGYFSGTKIFPVYDAFLSLRKLKPVNVIKTSCYEPLVISSLMIEDADHGRHLILVNHTNTKRSVTAGGKLYTLHAHEIKFISMK